MDSGRVKKCDGCIPPVAGQGAVRGSVAFFIGLFFVRAGGRTGPAGNGGDVFFCSCGLDNFL